jgi:hypothetical protein
MLKLSGEKGTPPVALDGVFGDEIDLRAEVGRCEVCSDTGGRDVDRGLLSEDSKARTGCCML